MNGIAVGQKPNVQSYRVLINKEIRILIKALRNIEKG
jgi:hypothetical protein